MGSDDPSRRELLSKVGGAVGGLSIAGVTASRGEAHVGEKDDIEIGFFKLSSEFVEPGDDLLIHLRVENDGNTDYRIWALLTVYPVRNPYAAKTPDLRPNSPPDSKYTPLEIPAGEMPPYSFHPQSADNWLPGIYAAQFTLLTERHGFDKVIAERNAAFAYDTNLDPECRHVLQRFESNINGKFTNLPQFLSNMATGSIEESCYDG